MCYREEAIECVKDHVLQIHKQIYAKYNGDFDRIYTEGYNSKSYTGRVIEPGKVYELSYLECSCPKVKCGLRNHPQQCECSRQSILYILSQLEPGSHFEVRIENTILRGSDRCTFQITRHEGIYKEKMMETERILLRPWRDSDAEVLYKWASDPDVGPRAGWAPHQSVEESLEIIRTVFNDALHTWAIELKETGEAIGAMGYGPSCECDLPAREGEPLIGYWVAKPYWNQGICTEALQLMLDHIRQTTDIKSLISGHFVDNPASGRVMEKCGFVPTGETCIDANQYQGANRPIRVLRLTIK